MRSRWLRPFAHLFGHPSLWHLNRRSAPPALAVGLFAAFIVPIGQFALAALLSVPLRANVPLAAGTTLVTNPLTFPPIYFGAYKVGSFLLHHSSSDVTERLTGHWGSELLGLTGPTALGLLVFALAGASGGFVVGTLWWRLRLLRRWRLRRAKLDSRL